MCSCLVVRAIWYQSAVGGVLWASKVGMIVVIKDDLSRVAHVTSSRSCVGQSWLSYEEMKLEFPRVIDGISRLIDGVSRRIHVMHRLIKGVTHMSNGITRQINCWGAGPGPPGPGGARRSPSWVRAQRAPGPHQDLQPLVRRVMPLINRSRCHELAD